MTTGQDYENIRELTEQFRKLISEQSGEPWEKVSAAIGYAVYNGKKTADEVFRKPDFHNALVNPDLRYKMKGRYIFFTITALILPFVLTMNAVMLVFTPTYLVHEYKSPDFPPDPYGFTLEERIEYGTESVNYITDFLHKYPDNYLAGLTMKDGKPLYNERETSHMLDVRIVFQNARAVMSAMIVFIIVTAILVSRKPDSLPGFLKSLICGSSLTLFLIVLVGIGILTGFDAFFEAFHHLFFTGDSWLFYADDSLIRLFPEKLWVDGFSLAAGLTALFALLILVISLTFVMKFKSSKSKFH